MKVPSEVKYIKAIPEFPPTIRTQVCDIGDYLSEPGETYFVDLESHEVSPKLP